MPEGTRPEPEALPEGVLEQVRAGIASWRAQRLGQLAIAKGLITEAQWKECADDDAETICRALSSRGLIPRAELQELLLELWDRDAALIGRRYEIVAKLGDGSAGEVYEAWDRRLGRKVAVKLMKPAANADAARRERFRREAAAAARLSHPNLVQVFDADEAGARMYIVMELVRGEPFSRTLRRRSVPIESLVGIVEAVAHGVQHAHERGIVHRDLKPGNIIVEESGRPKVVDFGLARLTDTDSTLTRTGAAMGTPLYMAPEQAEGNIRDIGPRTDVYALGAILYEVLTGRCPHVAETPAQVYRRISEEEPLAPRKINADVLPAWETICLKALEKSPARRYATAGEFAEDLRRCSAGEPILARPPHRLDKLLRSFRRNAARVMVATILLAAGVTAIAWIREKDRRVREYARLYDTGVEEWNGALTLLRGGSSNPSEIQAILDRCVRRFEDAARVMPDRPDPWLMIGRCRLLRGEEDPALRAWEEALRRDARCSPVRLDRGMHYLAKRRRLPLPAAVRISAGQARFAPRDPESPEEIEWLRKGREEIEEARRGTGLSAADERHLEGILAFCEARYADAIEDLRQYAAEKVWDAGAWALLAYAEYGVKDFAAAEEHLGRALRLSRTPDWLRARGDARICVGRAKEALDDYEACLKLSPDDRDAQCNRGLALRALGRLEEAERALDAVIQRWDRFARAYNGRGLVRLDRRDLEGAGDDFRQAIFLNPSTNVEHYNNLGIVLMLQGRSDEAVEEFDTVLQLDPDFVEARLNRARARGDLDGALEDCAAYSRRAPGDPESYLLAAGLLQAAGRADKARGVLGEALRAVTDDASRERIEAALRRLSGEK
ncbi:MAG: protein kinase [Planctomycetes bacterium]|nr:protein kinase [Planctomycetota bacterium]